MAARPDSTGQARFLAPGRARVRTLIVDDSEAVRAGLGRLVAAQSYCELVGAVGDAVAAVQSTRDLRPDVVLLDFSMAGVDPFRLTRDLTACSPRPAVLVLSASFDRHAARQLMDAGATGWVLKDAEPERLFATLLDAAGWGRRGRASARARAADAGPPLDARTVWALLRAFEEHPAGLSAEEAAARAVLPVPTAVRYIQRLAVCRPALVARAFPGSRCGRHVLMPAGRREIERLERRIPEHSARVRAAI